MPSTYHDQLSGNDLHDNKVYPVTGTPLPSWSPLDSRFVQRVSSGALSGAADLGAVLAALDARYAYKTSVTVGLGSYADYPTGGTSDQNALNNALAYLVSHGGGEVVLYPGVYNFDNRAYSNLTSGSTSVPVTVRALVPGSVTIRLQFERTTSVSAYGAITFYSDGAVPLRNVRVQGIIFDHNGYKTPGVVFRGNTSTAVTSQNLYVDACEFLNRAGDASGSLASILAMGDYPGAAGGLRNVQILDCEFHDNTANVGTRPYSVLVLSNSLETFRMRGCRYRDLYGTTVALGASTTSTRKDWIFDGNSFANTKLGSLGTGTTVDIFDSSRRGFTGIKVLNNCFEDNQAFTAADDKFHLAVYNSPGFLCSHNDFYYSREVLAPGHSSPSGNESVGWTFSDNLMVDILYFSDFDGHYAGTYDNNIFVRAKKGRIFGGYGQHCPSSYTNNLFYNCCLTPDTTAEWRQGLFLIEDGGNIVANNTIYNDAGQTAMKYVFCELEGGGPTTTVEPNIYENNRVIGAGPSAASFYLDANFKHIIKGNTGLKEAVIKNSQTSGTPGVTNLAETDIVEGNYRSDGSPVSSPVVRIKTKTANYTATTQDQNKTILANATSGAVTITLPDATTVAYPITIKRTSSGSNSVTVGCIGGQTIDSASTKTLGVAYSYLMVVSDGSNYAIVGQGGTVT